MEEDLIVAPEDKNKTGMPGKLTAHVLPHDCPKDGGITVIIIFVALLLAAQNIFTLSAGKK